MSTQEKNKQPGDVTAPAAKQNQEQVKAPEWKKEEHPDKTNPNGKDEKYRKSSTVANDGADNDGDKDQNPDRSKEHDDTDHDHDYITPAATDKKEQGQAKGETNKNVQVGF